MVTILLRYPIKIKSRQNNSQLTKNHDLKIIITGNAILKQNQFL